MSEYNYKLLNSYGEDVYISSNVEIKRPHLVNLGKHVAIDSGFYCTTQLKIGDYVHVGPYITVIGGKDGLLKIGNFSTLGAGSRIICASDEFKGAGLMGYGIPEEYMDNIHHGGVIIDNFASVATNCVILQGVKIAEGSVIGAGSVVTKDTEPWQIYMGIPAKPVQERPREKILRYAKELGYN